MRRAPEANDFDAYLDFLDAHHHNFIRLRRWEQVTDARAAPSASHTPLVNDSDRARPVSFLSVSAPALRRPSHPRRHAQ
jgi:hypothetical protein